MSLTQKDLEAIKLLVTEVIDTKLEPIIKRLDSLERRFDSLESRFDNLEGRFDDLESKVDRLEAKDISGVSVDIAEAILLADNAASKGSEPDMARLASLLERARQTQVVRDRPRLAAMLERLSGGMGANGDGTPIDPMAEWQGMPEFEQEDNFGAIATVKVHFATPEDIKHFSHLMEQTVNENTTFIWFPKQKPENLKVYRVSYES